MAKAPADTGALSVTNLERAGMDQTTVRAVYRLTLDSDEFGQITARALNLTYRPFPDGAAVVLDVGSGYWITAGDLEHIRFALSNVQHVSITSSTYATYARGVGHFGEVRGIDAIAERLAELLAVPPLFGTA